MSAARRVTVSHVLECRAVLVSVDMKVPVLVIVFTHCTKLIQVLRSAVSAHPGHAASDAFAQTFLVPNL